MSTEWRRLAAPAILLVLVVTGCSGQPGSPSRQGANPATPSVLAGTDLAGTIETGHYERTYVLHLPPGSTRLMPTPLVLALHGWPMTADQMSNVTHLSAVADTHGFAVLFPQGYARSWSVPGGAPTPAHNAGIDDVAFVSALLDSVGPRYGLDTSRVTAAGISNGGYLVQVLGCALAGRLAGIVPVAAPIRNPPTVACNPSRPISVLEIVGSDDQDAGSFPGTLAFWSRTDKCPNAGIAGALPDVAHDGTTVTTISLTGCSGGTEVTGYLVNGGGHAWPGGEALGSVDEFGVTSKQFNASELIWTFLSRHR
jgi:polyhydroxybutyrate depolymerase